MTDFHGQQVIKECSSWMLCFQPLHLLTMMPPKFRLMMEQGSTRWVTNSTQNIVAWMTPVQSKGLSVV